MMPNRDRDGIVRTIDILHSKREGEKQGAEIDEILPLIAYKLDTQKEKTTFFVISIIIVISLSPMSFVR